MTMDIKTVNEEFSVSAQIDLDDLKLLSERGVRSLICNRPDGEAADQINVTEVETAAAGLGMAVVYLPVVSGSFSEQDVSDFLAAMERLRLAVINLDSQSAASV